MFSFIPLHNIKTRLHKQKMGTAFTSMSVVPTTGANYACYEGNTPAVPSTASTVIDLFNVVSALQQVIGNKCVTSAYLQNIMLDQPSDCETNNVVGANPFLNTHNFSRTFWSVLRPSAAVGLRQQGTLQPQAMQGGWHSPVSSVCTV
jgi:hypothetical protein